MDSVLPIIMCVKSSGMSAAVHQVIDIPSHNDEFIQYAADGYNTFHGMNIFTIVTPKTKSCQTVSGFKVKLCLKEFHALVA